MPRPRSTRACSRRCSRTCARTSGTLLLATMPSAGGPRRRSSRPRAQVGGAHRRAGERDCLHQRRHRVGQPGAQGRGRVLPGEGRPHHHPEDRAQGHPRLRQAAGAHAAGAARGAEAAAADGAHRRRGEARGRATRSQSSTSSSRTRCCSAGTRWSRPAPGSPTWTWRRTARVEPGRSSPRPSPTRRSWSR